MSGNLSKIAVVLAATGVTLAVAAGAILSNTSSANAADAGEHLVTIHDRGKVRTILTRQTVLRDALKEADYNLDTNDLVEPGLNEELVARDYQVNIYRARPIVIQDGNTKQLVMSAYQTPKQIAKHAGITLQDEDDAALTMTDSIIRDGASTLMQIDRATPLRLVLYGKKQTVYTQTTNVADFLKEKDITIGAKDTLSIKAASPITEDMKIEVWRNGKQTITRNEKIDFETEQIEDKDHKIGYKKITNPGAKGNKTVTYEIIMKNGKEIKRKKIQSVVIKKPIKQVEIIGAKPSFSGDFGAALAKLRACESGGSYSNKNNPLYRGAYQFGYTTWGNRYGIHDPADASPAQQDAAARELYERRGWQPWPHCGANLPDTYR